MKGISFWFHLLFWIVYTLIFTIVEASYKGEYWEAFLFELTNLPMRLILVYFNYFILLPKFLLQGKTLTYFVYTIVSLIIAGFIQRIINYEVLNSLNPNMRDFGLWLPYKFLQSSIIIASPLIFVVGISVIWKVAELQKKTKSLENEKLQSELKYLKSQINPHFLFNTLNNIYGLSLENSEKTPDLLLKLSDFLSFSLYESGQKLIPLEKEISLMFDFIELEKSRFEDRVEVKITTPEKIDNIMIPPLILVPFVENAFKHGLKDETEIASIDIKLSTNKEGILFHVKNSKIKTVVSTDKKNGLGLKNIQKRLDILYSDNYSLKIEDNDTVFLVELKINLS